MNDNYTTACGREHGLKIITNYCFSFACAEICTTKAYLCSVMLVELFFLKPAELHQGFLQAAPSLSHQFFPRLLSWEGNPSGWQGRKVMSSRYAGPLSDAEGVKTSWSPWHLSWTLQQKSQRATPQYTVTRHKYQCLSTALQLDILATS